MHSIKYMVGGLIFLITSFTSIFLGLATFSTIRDSSLSVIQAIKNPNLLTSIDLIATGKLMGILLIFAAIGFYLMLEASAEEGEKLGKKIKEIIDKKRLK